MKILKFGGTSLGTPERIESALYIIQSAWKKKKDIAVVVSAFGGVTNQLIRASDLASEREKEYEQVLETLEQKHLDFVRALLPVQKQAPTLAEVKVFCNKLGDVLHGIFLLRESSRRTLDYVMSFGERLSAYIINQVLRQRGYDVEYLDTRLLVNTDDTFGMAQVNYSETYANIRKYFARRKNLQIITGFIGSTAENKTTTLGRNGSDFTASLFAGALNATEVEIWTDVDGVMSADPNKVPTAFSLQRMSYREAMEMSHFGAKVIHPPSIHPVMEKNIPIRIKNTLNPSFPGTLIGKGVPRHRHLIKGISSIDEVALLQFQGSGLAGTPGISGRLFSALARHNISVIMISQASSEYSICFVVPPGQPNLARKAVEEEFRWEKRLRLIDEVTIESDLSVIAIIGESMRHHVGISGRFFQALAEEKVNIVAIAQGSSELNVSIVIKKKDEIKALNATHRTFFFPQRKDINIFLVGPGLVGKTVLKQVYQQADLLATEYQCHLRLAGIADSRKMAFNAKGFAVTEWETVLAKPSQRMNLQKFIDHMKKMRLPGSVFVDCTSTTTIPDAYAQILESGTAVVTPNKKANSGTYQLYKTLQDIVREKEIPFFYNTNVGAGLPILETLQSLKKTGDTIYKIEGVLSGTLSYIFNTFTGEKPFSAVVKEAQEKGYTEPDPRDDLNGTDVARKILLLSRETGASLEPDDVQVENLVPKNARHKTSSAEFFRNLSKADGEFTAKLNLAQKNQKVLRYMATFENGSARVALEQVGADHPFYALSGSENIVAFTTERYKKEPLVIRGPGAGAEVTAAGIFADILRTV